jgi:hypothetical protein
VNVQAPDARARSRRQQLDLLAKGEGARDEGPRDDRAEPTEGEGAVQGQPEEPVGGPRRQGVRHRAEGRSQARQPLPRHRGDPQDRRALEERALDELAGLELRQGLHLLVGQVALGEHQQALRDPQQAADVEVLAGLGHHRLVGGDHEQRRVDAVGARQHVAHEALVAGDVDERRDQVPSQINVREAQVDRDPPLLLLLEPVGIGAGEGAHQRALAVVDVARGPDDQGAHGQG